MCMHLMDAVSNLRVTADRSEYAYMSVQAEAKMMAPAPAACRLKPAAALCIVLPHSTHTSPLIIPTR